MKTCFALTALAAIGFASAAYAGDATAPKAMSDSELDKVAAGRAFPSGTPGTSTFQVNLPGQAFRANGANSKGNSQSSGHQPPTLF